MEQWNALSCLSYFRILFPDIAFEEFLQTLTYILNFAYYFEIYDEADVE